MGVVGEATHLIDSSEAPILVLRHGILFLIFATSPGLDKDFIMRYPPSVVGSIFTACKPTALVNTALMETASTCSSSLWAHNVNAARLGSDSVALNLSRAAFTSL